ncbi:MAG: inositol monophosphatase family protein [Halobacteria archaeon]
MAIDWTAVAREVADGVRLTAIRHDEAAEDALEAALKGRGFCARVFSEERGGRTVGSGTPSGLLLYDPVDGSNNLLRAIPYYATSLAWVPNGSPETLGGVEEGVVLEIPRGELYWARKGKGAAWDGRALGPGASGPRLPKPLIALYAYGAKGPLPDLQPLLEGCLVRTPGAISLDLCLLARGAFDAVVDLRGLLRSFDVAAGLLIAREAGCVVSDSEGKEFNPGAREEGFNLVAARSRELHDALFGMLGRPRA